MSFGLIMRRAAPAAALALVTTLAGCYVDSSQDRAPTTGNGNTIALRSDTDASLCRTTLAKGCFDGYVLAAKEFTVDGKQFFNADDLTARFKELLTVDGAVGKDDYQLQLETPVDNQSFVQGFEYILSGETVRHDRIRNDGSFALNELPEGQYDLRVQRSVKFTVTHAAAVAAPKPAASSEAAGSSPTQPNQPAQPAQPAQPNQPAQPAQPNQPAQPAQPAQPNQPAQPAQPAQPNQPAQPATAATVAQTFCATIYADTTLDIRRNQRFPPQTFSDFRLHVTDSECDTSGADATISLRD